MKFEVEIADEDCEFLKERLKIDVTKMIPLFTAQIVEYLKQVALAQKAGVTITSEEVNRLGKAVGEQVMRDSKIKEEFPNDR